MQALGHGLGSVWQRTKDEKFEHVYVDPSSGRQVTKTLAAANKSAAVREAAGRVEKIGRGEIAKPSTITFGELAEQFFLSFEARTISGERSARSLEDYRRR